MTPDDVVNNALEIAGHPERISSLWDGSPEAAIARDLYGETRDEALAAQPWNFARAFYALNAFGAPATGWLYSYSRPATAITLLDVYPGNLTEEQVLDARPSRWLEVRTGTRLIQTRFSPAIAAVTDRVVDPTTWVPDFTAMVVEVLARKLQAAFGKEQVDESRGHR